MRSRPRLQALVGVALVLTAACSWFGGTSAEQRLRTAEQFLAKGDPQAALIELRHAVRLEPQSGRVRERLGDAYTALRDGNNALAEYSRAADLLPDDLGVQMKAGQVLLAAQKFEDARVKADAVLRRDPKHVDAQVLRANALAGLQEVDEAVAELQRAVAADPTRGITFSRLGAMEARRGKLEEAEASFRRAVELSPNEPRTHLALANFLQAVGRWQEAELSLRKALELDPKDLRTTRALATFYLAAGRRADAEPLLRAAAAQSSDPEEKLVLADFLIGGGRLDEARRILEGLTGDARAAGGAIGRLALLDAAGGAVDAANTRLDAALQKAPSNGDLLLAKGRVLLAGGRAPDAIERLKAATAARPFDADAHFWLAEAYRLQRDLDAALGAYNEAMRQRPAFAQAAVGAAGVELLRGNAKAALSFAQSAVFIQPTLLEPRLMLIEALVATGNTQRALEESRMVAEAAPKEEGAQTLYARVLAQRGDLARSRQVTAAVLQLNPASVAALEVSVGLAVRDGKADVARAQVESALKGAPRDARVLLLAARAASATKDLAATERHLRAAVEVEPNLIEAYQWLGQLYLSQNRAKDAQREFDQAAARQPANVGAATMAAIIAEGLGEVEDARRRYERILEARPEAPAAANNLAWIIANTPDANLDVALNHAQAAKRGLPESAEVNDTLGFIYVKKGLHAMAVPHLRAAAAKLPNQPIVRWHLAQALAGAGDKPGAIAEAERALGLDATFEGADAARALVQKLRSS